MKFENAHEGVKKIYTAELLAILASVCVVAVAISGVVALAAGGVQSAVAAGGAIIGAGIFGIAAGVLAIISFILSLVGINRASRDEDAFKKALYAAVAGIVISVIGTFTKDGSLLNGLFSTLNGVCNLLVTFMVCQGVVNLAEKLENAAVSEKGRSVQKLLLTVWIIVIVVRLIVAVMGGAAAGIFAGILSIVAGVIAIAAYFLYLGLLGRAKKMLE